MKSLVITIVGKDKPGLIDSLAKVVYQHQGNWLNSSFSRMAGQFAGFAEIHIPAEEETAILDTFSKHPDLNVILSEGKSADAQQFDTVELEIIGNDKAGIVQEVTGILNQFNLNICQLNSEFGSAPNWGSAIFKANATIDVPKDFDLDELKESLEEIASDLMVEISFK